MRVCAAATWCSRYTCTIHVPGCSPVVRLTEFRALSVPRSLPTTINHLTSHSMYEHSPYQRGFPHPWQASGRHHDRSTLTCPRAFLNAPTCMHAHYRPARKYPQLINQGNINVRDHQITRHIGTKVRKSFSSSSYLKSYGNKQRRHIAIQMTPQTPCIPMTHAPSTP